MPERHENERTTWSPDRRRLLSLGLGAFVVAAVPLALRRRHSGEPVRRQVPVMGTIADLVVVADTRAEGHAAIEGAVQALRHVDATMSAYAAASDVGRANASAAQRAVVVTSDTAHVVRRALDVAARTDGAFDPCLGALRRVWDLGARREPLARDAVAALALAGRWRHVDVDGLGGQPCLHFEADDVQLDLGGIAKGYGVDLAVDALRRAGIRQALVNVGGDLAAIGRSPDGDPWLVGIRSPGSPEDVIATVAVEDEAVATSGDYEQGFDHAGRRYHHIFDGPTGEPRRTASRTLTVRAATCIDADAAATAAFGQEPSSAQAFLDRGVPGARVVHLA